MQRSNQFFKTMTLTLICFLLHFLANANQNLTPIEQSLQQLRLRQKPFRVNDLSISLQASLIKIPQQIKNAAYFHLDKQKMTEIRLLKPEYLITQFVDAYGQMITVELERQLIMEPGARMISPDDATGTLLQEGAFYRGIIKGKSASIAAISFLENEIVGVLSTQEEGNIIIGKPQVIDGISESQSPHMLYYESDLNIQSPFTCGVPDINPSLVSIPPSNESSSTITAKRCKKIRVYLECDYNLYTRKNNSKPSVESYITSVFNVVKTLYFNDQINVEISQIFVWTTQDSYLHSTLPAIIYDYAAKRNKNFNGDLAQLISTVPPQQQGGIAFLDGLCREYGDGSGRSPHSFAFIFDAFSTFPTYSWTVEVMTHEMGHNIGSPHTHNCVWGPNKNTSIDNCTIPDDGTSCTQGPRPTNGGTIMSYCHLVNGVGINFTKGFGPEPGQLMRDAITSKSCLSRTVNPTVKSSIAGPFYEGDSVRLRANPFLGNYTYDWFHYDVLLQGKNDTVITTATSGEYRVAISTDCTEFSSALDVKINPIVVNLGCEVIAGKVDSLSFIKTMNADDNTLTDSIIVPASAYQNIPSNIKDILVELYVTINPLSTNTLNKSVFMTYTGPNKIVENINFDINANDGENFRQLKTYHRKLGVFDPKGTWKFTTKDLKADPGIDARVSWNIVLKWKAADVIPTCNIPICGNSNRILDAGIVGGIYKWSTGAVSKTITVNTPGTYSVTVTKNGKTASHAVNLVSKNTQFSQSVSICEGDSLEIGSSTYKTSGVYTNSLIAADGCDSVLVTTLKVNPNQSTTLDITACYNSIINGTKITKDIELKSSLKTHLGCDSIVITKIKVLPELILDGIVAVNCENIGASLDATVIGGKAPYSLQWSNGQSAYQLAGLKDGKYILKVTDGNSCLAEKEFIVDNYDSVGITPVIKNVNCFAESNGSIEAVLNSGTQPINYSWSTGNTTNKIIDIKKGKYTLYASDKNGCTFNAEYNVTEPELLISILDTKSANGSASDGSITPTVFGGIKPYKYKWSTGDTSMILENIRSGNYAVTITDANGCMTQNSVQVISGINNPIVNEIILAPNPVFQKLLIESTQQSIVQYQVFDIAGKNVMHSKNPITSSKISIDCFSLANGNYFIQLKFNDGSQVTRRFIKN